MALWLSRKTLESATNRKLVAASFADDETGAFQEDELCEVIERAEGEVLSWLAGEYGPVPFTPAMLAQFKADSFLKYCALDFGVAFMLEKHPEYVRSSEMQSNRKTLYDGATERMKRVKKAEQEPPKVPTSPANVGGVSVGSSANLYIDSPGGMPGGNAGDY